MQLQSVGIVDPVNMLYIFGCVTGILVLGHWAAAYFDLHQWPHDPNLTMPM